MLHLGQEWDVSDMVSLQNAKSAHGHHPRNKENIEKLSVITAVCAPPNQHQINVNAWLPPWLEIDNWPPMGFPGVSILIMGLVQMLVQCDTQCSRDSP